MAKLTRKIWVGIGAATIAGASLAGHGAAQSAHKGHAAGDTKAGAATATPAEGGEAYLTDGGPPTPASASTATSS